MREGELVALTGKAFDTLLALVEGAGTLQRQQSLMDRLWPDVTVEQNSLQYNVSLVRRALSDAEGVEIRDRSRSGLPSPRRGPRPVVPPPTGPRAPRARCSACTSAKPMTAHGRPTRVGEGAFRQSRELAEPPRDRLGQPVWKHWLELLGRDHCFVRYDARGNGLSGWEPPSIACEDFVADLGAVFDAAGRSRAVLGISQGAAVAAAYAARHPERVSALILIGGCARGWRVKQTPALTRVRSAHGAHRQGWGGRTRLSADLHDRVFSGGLARTGRLVQRTATADHVSRERGPHSVCARRWTPRRARARTCAHLGAPQPRRRVMPIKAGIELASGHRRRPLRANRQRQPPLARRENPPGCAFTQEFEGFMAEVGA